MIPHNPFIAILHTEHMVLLAGIDDAGRGPIIGPLVMAGVMIKGEDEQQLKQIRVKDSKMLTPAQREKMFDQIIQSVAAYSIKIMQPHEVDEAVKDHGLNLLEARATIEIINELKPDIAIIDCPDTNIQKFKEFIENLKSVPCKIQPEHKADVNHAVVSAASILAKVTRDREIEKIQKMIPYPIGSGYPADPVTKAFMEKYHEVYPDIFRKSWQTFKKLKGGKSQKKIGEW